MKVGIITFHRAHNCGAALQCVALRVALEKLGHDVKVIDCNDVGDGLKVRIHWQWNIMAIAHYIVGLLRVYLNRTKWRYRLFQIKHMRLTRKKFGFIPSDFDCYVLGSDQVLNPQHTGEFTNTFLLSGCLRDKRKVAYAASFGVETFPVDLRDHYSKCLEQFYMLGIREAAGCRICRAELNVSKEVQMTLDPTLLLNSDDYLRFESRIDVDGDFVLVYWIGNSTQAVLAVANRIAKKLNAKVVIASLVSPRAPKDSVFVSPDQFLYLIRRAQFVVTTSFHGTAFSIVNRKPFLTILPDGLNVSGRMLCLLENLGIPQNAIPEQQAFLIDDFPMSVDYNTVYRTLDSLRKASWGFLRRAIVD